MTGTRILVVLLAATLATASAGLLAEKGGKGKDHGGPPGQSMGGGPPGKSAGKGGGSDKPEKAGRAAKGGGPPDRGGAVLISSGERGLIHDYFRLNPYPAQGLPPGIAKNLARGKPLPPGIAKRYLPPGLLGQLPPRPGYEWVAVGRDVVLIAIATGIVIDILSDVF
jgi:hypothetical protein